MKKSSQANSSSLRGKKPSWLETGVRASLKAHLLQETREDQRQAIAFYLKESLELARRFMRELVSMGMAIGEPHSLSSYAIIFRERSRFVTIVVLAHTSRDIGYWMDCDIPDTL
jgi:hypothetical protein